MLKIKDLIFRNKFRNFEYSFQPSFNGQYLKIANFQFVLS